MKYENPIITKINLEEDIIKTSVVNDLDNSLNGKDAINLGGADGKDMFK